MKNVKRIYQEFIPENYNLELIPNKEAMSFTGTVTIKGKRVGKPSKRITFHQKDLTITDATITKHDKKGDENIPLKRLNHQNSLNEVRLHIESHVYPGAYTITLTFKGTITKKMSGMYPCYFKDNGKEKIIIATQFESHHAREVFPCVDEPEAKATFDLTLHSPQGETVLANTPVKDQIKKSKSLITTFETTPVMSTYLLAFAYGELHCVESKTKDGILVRSWASVAQPKKTLQYSVDEATKILDFFTDYFGVAFPLPKVDQLALPDFESGAMENWGLITYREIALLSDPDNPSIDTEQYISMVVAHELSHQWFGNLVTMKWWDDLWLNESFASLMEHLALDALHPDWKQWESYTASDVIATTSRDIYSNIQPVGVEVTDPDLIHTLFDPGIVYAKGGRLLKMLREHIGDDAFAGGLNHYFKKHAFKNTTREDLWESMSHASNIDVSALMTPWITQSGLPIVHAKQRGDTLELTQEQYLVDTDDTNNKIWPIPLLADKKLPIEVFDKKHSSLQLDNSDPVIFNKTASGHFVTHYETKDQATHIARAFADMTLPIEARMNVLNSMYMLSRIGKQSITTALDIAISNPKESRDKVWSMISMILNLSSQLIEEDELKLDQMRALKKRLASHWFSELGWDDEQNEDVNTKELRHTMIAYMLAGEDEASIAKTLSLYHKFADNLANLNADLRALIIGTAVKFEGEEVAEHLMTVYENSSAELQLDITSALSATRDSALAKKILQKAVGPDGFVRSQDLLRWTIVFMRNHYVRHSAWEHTLEHWDWMVEELKSSKSFDMLPSYISKSMSTQEWLSAYNKQFKNGIDKAMDRNITIGRSEIESRIAWRKRDEKNVRDWLDKNAV